VPKRSTKNIIWSVS